MESPRRFCWSRAGVSTAAVTLALVALVDAGCRPRKKLIEWGWDEPNTAFLRAHIREMEKTPFDGCVFSVRHGPGGRGGSFSWQFWGRRRFERAELAAAFADLRATRFRRFRENFLRVNVTPGNIDWFDDFSPVVANARLAGELANAGRARGVLLDVEQYQGSVFEHRRGGQAASRSWSDDAATARQRGREVATAFQDGHPGLVILLSFGYTLPWVLSDHGQKPLSETPYGLLAPFLDGMLDAARGQTRLVDGYELSYGFKESRQFDDARRLFSRAVLPIVADPRRYRNRMRLGFGLWLDYDWRRRGWSELRVEDNYFSPDRFAQSLEAAVESTDGYVWVYAEHPAWWSSSKREARVPDAYVAAVRRVSAAAR